MCRRRSSRAAARRLTSVDRLHLRRLLPVVLVFATLSVILFNLVVDTLYAWVDPRIRLS
ncbi:MAG TPA: hypothetical protein VGP69_06500 [Gaiellaceae bacterium]|nr:hypothetical protein [Gaiellaceae bacterium]